MRQCLRSDRSDCGLVLGSGPYDCEAGFRFLTPLIERLALDSGPSLIVRLVLTLVMVFEF